MRGRELARQSLIRGNSCCHCKRRGMLHVRREWLAPTHTVEGGVLGWERPKTASVAVYFERSSGFT